MAWKSGEWRKGRVSNHTKPKNLISLTNSLMNFSGCIHEIEAQSAVKTQVHIICKNANGSAIMKNVDELVKVNIILQKNQTIKILLLSIPLISVEFV